MRPSEGRISFWPAAVIAFGLLLVALSITPTVKLTTTPPSDFAVGESSVPPKNLTTNAYWQVAESVIQWKYSRTTALPEQVPPEFRLATEQIVDQAARATYWAKLRQEWLRSENWHTSYRFDVSWPLRNASNLSREVLSFINQT